MIQYPKKRLAQLVLQHCLANEVENVVISPGSRNAPLTIGFVNHPKIHTFSIVDERSAAFFALGIAQQTHKPVAVICSSGSAMLNYYPAVAEAYYGNIPLVVISADRPKHLIGIGDGQTINQENVFKNHVLFNANLIADKQALESNHNLLKKALQLAINQQGPVHINIPFDEPLYDTVDALYDFELEFFKKNKPKNSLLEELPLEVDELQKFANIWNASSKKMVLIGAHAPNTLIQTQLSHVVKDPSVLVLTETISNVYDKKFINNIDQLIIPLDEKDLEKLAPEVLITFGGMLVSKKVKQFLRTYPPKHHWHIDKKNAPDTFHCLSKHFNISAPLFFSQFFFLTKPKETNYQSKWLKVKLERKHKHEEFINRVSFSDFKVFDLILKSLPDSIAIQVANSSTIRYTQLFDLNNTLQVFCNRGTSGIDGSTSTAIGAAFAQKKQTVFITGDISFFYDSNALWNRYIKNNFRIILVNNSGGGIFRFIPGPQTTNALDYFETPHKLDASHLCKMFAIDYYAAKNEKELNKELETFYTASKQPKLLEIFTPASLNDQVLKNYFLHFN